MLCNNCFAVKTFQARDLSPSKFNFTKKKKLKTFNSITANDVIFL